MQLKCELADSKASYELEMAVLIYSNKSAKVSGVASVNPIKDGKIMPGRPLDGSALNQIINDLSGNNKRKRLEFIPERVLAQGNKAVMWWSPSRVAPIWFKAREDKLNAISGAMVRYPSILFRVIDGRMCAWALYGNNRPVGTSMLFQMPFYNCSGDGWVCLPQGIKLPASEPGAIADWEKLFYDSNFSHAGMGVAIIKGGHAKFWTRYANQCKHKMPKRFPAEFLLSTNIKLEDLLNEEK
ncbi:MAG: hypothetical protein JXR78_01765 [Victivallales bacterium]|nr:hypothetical protein [Victivallales bacterium]